ncbi:MAG: hypothetical protein A2070_15180 [Bdellovibrionales bacterium GWC1_52_8]|nr:MAG: hypothetical protein A2Z97_05570 [Bdellovibrionales bacterium GWB1_52_6]OFZ04471.1 MAG: hypothetical protein A2X97_06785 [Bdellovibrionales bacterium GWA1_52_35]OFZ40374.1 MAG: hypothetical protein A2070_15180 [Bdellovibrionales bacterium GWC1_52_8]
MKPNQTPGNNSHLDDPSRVAEIREKIRKKEFLRALYLETYSKYSACLKRCPASGQILELGSGGGFSKEVIPQLITSDIIPYEGVDRIVDATQIPFPDRSLRAIFLFNVFHHIPDVRAFFREAMRCLVPGGRILIIDPYFGWISSPIYNYLHHEPSSKSVEKWEFESSGPLSDANIALAWIVFQRDRAIFESEFAKLNLVSYKPHSPLRYWISGGLKNWSLASGSQFETWSKIDNALISLSEKFASFVDIELVKQTDQ